MDTQQSNSGRNISLIDYTQYVYIYIWVNYNISLTWIKAIWEWFPLLTMIPGFGRSEVVIKFTQRKKEKEYADMHILPRNLGDCLTFYT